MQTVYVAGHRGLVGSAVWRALEARGDSRLVGATSSELDLRDRAATRDFVEAHQPDVVVVAAARVGGIEANNTRPAEFLSDNLQIQTSLMDAAAAAAVPRLLFLGSSCIYPRLAEQPIREDSLLTGELEPTNDAYAIAKIAGVMQVQSVRRQYGLPWISAMPTNLYGPHDNFDPVTSHVFPAMIRRFDTAVREGAESVTLWGSGTPRREFLHSDDLAAAVLHLLEHYDDPRPINAGWGKDVTVRELAETVAAEAGYTGRLEWDTSRPDGMMRKVLDTSRITELGWAPRIGLGEGIARTLEWYRANVA